MPRVSICVRRQPSVSPGLWAEPAARHSFASATVSANVMSATTGPACTVQVWADVCLVFQNAKQFNPAGSDMYLMAEMVQVR